MAVTIAGLMLLGAVSVRSSRSCRVDSRDDISSMGYDYCGKEGQATCKVGCNGGRVWYGASQKIWFSQKFVYFYQDFGPGESVSCSNSGMGCDPFGGIVKYCYVQNFGSLPNGISLRYEDASCENNFNLGTFDCPIECARVAHDTPQCDGSNRIIFDGYYSVEHASWGCRCCKDDVVQNHGIWELYEYTDAVADAIPFPDVDQWLEGPDEALPKAPKGTVVDILIDRSVAVTAVAVLGVLILLGLFLCLCRGGGGKRAVYRKVEMVSSDVEDEPMM